MFERIRKLFRVSEKEIAIDIFNSMPSEILDDLVTCPYADLQMKCSQVLTPHRLRQNISSDDVSEFYRTVYDWRTLIESRK